VSGRSKGYGFVRFTLEEERDRSLAEMNGQYCLSRPMRISVATPKGKGGWEAGVGLGVGGCSPGPTHLHHREKTTLPIPLGVCDPLTSLPPRMAPSFAEGLFQALSSSRAQEKA